MIYKKILIIFLLILSIFCFFSFSSVHAENINVISSSAERMKADIDYFKQVLKNNYINNMDDLKSFLHCSSTEDIQYCFIEDAGHTYYTYQYAYFYGKLNNLSAGVDNYSYYGIQQNSFKLPYYYRLRWTVYGESGFTSQNVNSIFTAPSCWLCVRTLDLLTMSSTEIVSNAINDVNNSVNNLNNKLTEDNSSQDDINLNSHNGEMDNASNKIKTSSLFLKFNGLINKMNEAFNYNDDEVSTIPISFYGKTYVLRSDTISSFFKNNNLGFVVLLWQSILWFSLFYTMFLFVRKIYKAVVGGNPVDDVSSTLSNEDNKIVGGF